MAALDCLLKKEAKGYEGQTSIPYHKLQKMTCINVLNWFFTLLSLSLSIGQACRIPFGAVKKFCQEYQTFGAFGIRFKSQYRRSDAFEKLTFDQKEGFQLQIHDEFRKFASAVEKLMYQTSNPFTRDL
jgi:hypothetical protein